MTACCVFKSEPLYDETYRLRASLQTLKSILLFLLVLVFVVDLSVDHEHSKHKVLTAFSALVITGVVIYSMHINSIDSGLSAYVVAGFLYFGSFLVYRLVKWLLR